MSKTTCFSFDEIKYIDKRTQCVVYAFIKQCQSLLPTERSYYNIPKLIDYIILLYHGDEEYFTVFGKSLRLFEDRKTIINTSGRSGNVYGNINIVGNGTLIYKWKFKILSERGTIYIGIDSSNKQCLNHYFYNDCPFYAFCDGEKYKHNYTEQPYGIIWNVNDIITMIFNSKDKILTYCVNGTRFESAFQDIDFSNDRIYHMVVRLSNSKESVQLLSFQLSQEDYL